MTSGISQYKCVLVGKSSIKFLVNQSETFHIPVPDDHNDYNGGKTLYNVTTLLGLKGLMFMYDKTDKVYHWRYKQGN